MLPVLSQSESLASGGSETELGVRLVKCTPWWRSQHCTVSSAAAVGTVRGKAAGMSHICQEISALNKTSRKYSGRQCVCRGGAKFKLVEFYDCIIMLFNLYLH